MKRVLILFIVLLLVILPGCSEYINPLDSTDTGESITPEQMAEISIALAQTAVPQTEASQTDEPQTDVAEAEIGEVSFVDTTSDIANVAKPDVDTYDSTYIGTTVPGTTILSDVAPEPLPSETNVVYWTPGGSVWHVTDSCSSLSRSKEILSGSEADAKTAGKDRVCKRCDG